MRYQKFYIELYSILDSVHGVNSETNDGHYGC